MCYGKEGLKGHSKDEMQFGNNPNKDLNPNSWICLIFLLNTSFTKNLNL